MADSEESARVEAEAAAENHKLFDQAQMLAVVVREGVERANLSPQAYLDDSQWHSSAAQRQPAWWAHEHTIGEESEGQMSHSLIAGHQPDTPTDMSTATGARYRRQEARHVTHDTT